ncbi:MAG TPA: hypothetical protein PLY16_02375 [Candidatus Saccharibacteria bacterium]|nr:hypothetical protein [Candidatus Saccharibacteria bacterium]
MSKRLLIILSFAIPTAIAAAVVLVLWLVQPNTSSVPDDGNNQSTGQENVIIPDLSVNFGACDMTSKEFIQSAFSGNLPTLQDANDLGRVFSGSEAIETHLCAYYLDAEQVLTHSLNIVVVNYTDEDVHSAEKSGIYAEAEPVTGIADTAAFYSSEAPDEGGDGLIQQSLRVDRANRAYTITLSQPSSSALSVDVVRPALESIAKSATYTTE